MRYLLLIGLLLVSIAGYATIYMQVDKNGNTQYSDIPQPNSQIITLAPPNQTVTPSTTPESTATKLTSTPSTKKPYTTFLLVSPATESTIQNQPIIPVELKIEPELQPGDTIQLYLDGKPWGQASTNIHPALSIIDRGTHSLSAAILDENLTVVKQSNANTIYVHQNRANFPVQTGTTP